MPPTPSVSITSYLSDSTVPGSGVGASSSEAGRGRGDGRADEVTVPWRVGADISVSAPPAPHFGQISVPRGLGCPHCVQAAMVRPESSLMPKKPDPNGRLNGPNCQGSQPQPLTSKVS